MTFSSLYKYAPGRVATYLTGIVDPRLRMPLSHNHCHDQDIPVNLLPEDRDPHVATIRHIRRPGRLNIHEHCVLLLHNLPVWYLQQHYRVCLKPSCGQPLRPQDSSDWNGLCTCGHYFRSRYCTNTPPGGCCLPHPNLAPREDSSLFYSHIGRCVSYRPPFVPNS